MKFVNRKEELERLTLLSKRDKGGFVVVCGRRRIGKTRLLLEWAKKSDGVYFVADQSASPVQRRYFSYSLELKLPGFSQIEYPDWPLFFQRIAHEAENSKWKGPLIIDEFPYLVEACPELPSILQRFIDHEAKKTNLLVAISGSSQRMMQGIVLDHSAPLYGRADELFNLQPLTIGYIKDFFNNLSDKLALEYYLIFGGIPRYWELLSGAGYSDIDNVIDFLALNHLGPLHSEPDRLLVEEKPPATSLRPILDVIGSGANKVSEIAGRIGISSTSLARPLKRLLEMGIIKREVPFGESEKSSKKSIYKIADPFFLFWFKVVAPNKASLVQFPSNIRKKIFRKYKQAILSQNFENLCRSSLQFLPLSLFGIKTGSFWGPASRFWKGNDPEWDIISISLDKKYILIGEVKFKETGISKSDIDKYKQSLFKKGLPQIKNIDKYNICYTLFVNKKIKYTNSDIVLINGSDIIKYMKI